MNTEAKMYVTLQPERFTVHSNITIRDGGLLPHLFTMTSATSEKATCFLWHYLFPILKSRPLVSQGTVLCVARTFLPPPLWKAIRQLAIISFRYCLQK